MRALNRITLRLRRTAYRLVFSTREGQTVLRDLAQFCRAHESAYDPDPRTHALLEGRREVWLRIQNNLQLDDEQLWRLQGGVQLVEQKEARQGAG